MWWERLRGGSGTEICSSPLGQGAGGRKQGVAVRWEQSSVLPQPEVLAGLMFRT